MDARARRLAVLCSHLRQVDLGSSIREEASTSLTSNCVSGKEKDCIFCKIVSGESPSFKIYEDDVCLCILDKNPLSHGHTLIIPKCHFSSLESTPPSIVASMCSKIPFVSSAIMKATNSDSFNLLVNNGAAAGQVIFHTHLHIVPRNDRDCLWKSESVPRQTLKSNEETDQLASCIRDHLSVNASDHLSVNASDHLSVNVTSEAVKQ